MQEVKQNKIPAPQTQEFISNTKVAMAKLTKDVESLVKNAEENKRDHERIIEKIDKFIEGADNKYANKENFIFWRNIVVAGILLTIFLGIIGNLT